MTRPQRTIPISLLYRESHQCDQSVTCSKVPQQCSGRTKTSSWEPSKRAIFVLEVFQLRLAFVHFINPLWHDIKPATPPSKTLHICISSTSQRFPSISSTSAMICSTLYAFCLITGALAVPITTPPALRTRSVATNQATCKGYNDSFWNVNQSVFEVTIGRPYLGGGRAAEIQSKINSKFQVSIVKISGTSNNKNTKITIISNMDAGNLANVNHGLHAAYPEIRFSCPTSL